VTVAPGPVEAARALAGITDPLERAQAAGELLGALAVAQEAAKLVRRDAVRELRESGWSHGDVAEGLGVARGTAQAIAEGRSSSGARRPAGA
jgi:DNA-directed RNA polymerase specialized sigma24 family protein